MVPSTWSVSFWYQVNCISSSHAAPLTWLRSVYQGWGHYYNPPQHFGYFGGNNGWNNLGLTPTSLNTIFHIAYTYDGTTFRYYLDGVMIDSDVSSINGYSNHVCFGGGGTSSQGIPDCGWWNLNGQLDDVAYYSGTVLTDSEVAAIYDGCRQ